VNQSNCDDAAKMCAKNLENLAPVEFVRESKTSLNHVD
jgi:hypothetical protein